MNRPKRKASDILAIAVYISVVGLPIIAVTTAWTASPSKLLAHFDDDAFYYFEIARNIAQGTGSTFDGINPTNGYHPLWLAALIPIFKFAEGNFTPLILVTTLQSLLWLSTIAIVYCIARQLGSVVSFLPSLVLLVYMYRFWFNGMESALSLPLLFLATLFGLRGGLSSSGRAALACGLSLGAAAMARLDIIFLTAMFCLGGLIWVTDRRVGNRSTLALTLVAPSALLIVGYTALNLGMFSTLVPVSGQAKSLGGPFLNFEVVRDYLAYRPLNTPILRSLNVGALLVLVVLPSLVILRMDRVRHGAYLSWDPSTCISFERIMWLFLAANFMQLMYYSFATSWPLCQWYYYYLPIELALSTAVLTNFALQRFFDHEKSICALPLLVGLVICVKLFRLYAYEQSSTPSNDLNYRTRSVTLANHLNSFPGTPVFAMGDRAGSLGYLLEAPLVQTEGLVNSYEYLTALKMGRVHAFLQDAGVNFVVYSGGKQSGGDPVRVPGSIESCFVIEEPKFGHGPKFRTVVCDSDKVFDTTLADPGSMGGKYTVWRYRAELNPATNAG